MMRLDVLMDEFADRLSRFGRIISPQSMHVAAFVSFLSSGLARTGLLTDHKRLVEEVLASGLPSPVRAEALYGSLHRLSFEIMSRVYEVIGRRAAIELVEGRASLKHVIEVLLRELGHISYVVLYDCLSIIEMLTMASSMRSKGYDVAFPSTCFINPLGLTRFMTRQARVERGTMRDVLEILVSSLGAQAGELVPEVDRLVHGHGHDIGEFLAHMDIEHVILACEEHARRGPTLVASDHGYDIIHTPGELYIHHGPLVEQQGRQIVLNLSRIAPFMLVFRRQRR